MKNKKKVKSNKKNVLVNDEHEAKLVRVYHEKDLNKLRDSNAKEIKKMEKKERKKIKKIESKVTEQFPLKSFSRNPLIDAVRINKTLIERDKNAEKAWKDEYFNAIFAEFKKIVKKYNEGLGFKEEELNNKIISLKKQVEKYENKIKKLEEINKILKENT